MGSAHLTWHPGSHIISFRTVDNLGSLSHVFHPSTVGIMGAHSGGAFCLIPHGSTYAVPGSLQVLGGEQLNLDLPNDQGSRRKPISGEVKSLGSHKINYFMIFNYSQGPSNKAFNLTLPDKMIPNHFILSFFFTLKLPFHK